MINDPLSNEQDLVGSKVGRVPNQSLLDHKKPGTFLVAHLDDFIGLPAFGIGGIDFLCGEIIIDGFDLGIAMGIFLGEFFTRLADGKMEGDAATAALLKADVVEPLRQLELELSRQLQQQSGRTNLRLRDEGAAPEKYRRAVEEYYRRLSGGRQRQ